MRTTGTIDPDLAAERAQPCSADRDFGRFPGLRWHNPILDLNVPLRGDDPTVAAALQRYGRADALYVSGGNTFYLLDRLRRSGFDQLVTQAVQDGLPYVGASAGALVAGPDIAAIASMDDPHHAPDLQSTHGLGLVDVVVLPHD